jgi:hypothetical protein
LNHLVILYKEERMRNVPAVILSSMASLLPITLSLHTGCKAKVISEGEMNGSSPAHKSNGGTPSESGAGGSNNTPPLVLPDAMNINHSDDLDSSAPERAPMYPELWYSAGDKLVYIELDKASGTPLQIKASDLVGLRIGQNSLTMLADGSLFGARLDLGDTKLTPTTMTSELYHIRHPPRDGSPAEVKILGILPNAVGIEALYTDCEGRLYGMDTGDDVVSTKGNRLLRFTGDFLAGDFQFLQVSDLSQSDVADIDDMSPGIGPNDIITDNPGLAIDSSYVYGFNFETGQGTRINVQIGDWGIHVLGGSLFTDRKSRVYVLSSKAELFALNLTDQSASNVLITGPPIPKAARPGHSGLAGPLTNCVTNFVIVK